MVESVSIKPVSVSDLRVAPVSRTPAAAAATAPAAQQSPAAAAAGLARTMAATPPVNSDRVAEIKAAIADGTYPILPETVADRLLALKLEWKPNDPA